MCNEKSNKNYLSALVLLHEDLKTMSSMPLLPSPESLVEKLKHVHLQCFIYSNFTFIEH